MANPNNALKYVAKNPFELATSDNYDWRSEDSAKTYSEKLKEDGFNTKVTSSFHRSTRQTEWRVWFRK